MRISIQRDKIQTSSRACRRMRQEMPVESGFLERLPNASLFLTPAGLTRGPIAASFTGPPQTGSHRHRRTDNMTDRDNGEMEFGRACGTQSGDVTAAPAWRRPARSSAAFSATRLSSRLARSSPLCSRSGRATEVRCELMRLRSRRIFEMVEPLSKPSASACRRFGTLRYNAPTTSAVTRGWKRGRGPWYHKPASPSAR